MGFCGVTIAKLVEEGKLSLDDPVSKYLPEFETLWVRVVKIDSSQVLHKAGLVEHVYVRLLPLLQIHNFVSNLVQMYYTPTPVLISGLQL